MSMVWPRRSRGKSAGGIGSHLRSRWPVSQRGKLRASISMPAIVVCAIGSAAVPDDVVRRTPRSSTLAKIG